MAVSAGGWVGVGGREGSALVQPLKGRDKRQKGAKWEGGGCLLLLLLLLLHRALLSLCFVA